MPKKFKKFVDDENVDEEEYVAVARAVAGKPGRPKSLPNDDEWAAELYTRKRKKKWDQEKRAP